jgi:hypothetical protein
MFSKKLMPIAIGAVLSLTCAGHSKLYFTGILGNITPIDFSDTTKVAGHQIWDTWTPGGGAGTTRYFNLELDGNSSGGNKKCFDVFFSPKTGSASNTDIRVFNSSGSSIDDDGPSPSLLPHFRAWLGTSIYTTVSAYSSTYNNVDFTMTTQDLGFTTSAACTSANNYPMVDDGGTITNANSRAN